MSRNTNKFMLLLMVLAMLLSSTIGATTVYADDGDATGETSEPVGGETPPVDDVVPSEPPGGEVISNEEQPAAPVEETTPVSEILEQLPEETEVVVVNEAGEVEPLASIEAAEIVQSGDPRLTLSGTTYYFMPLGGCGALANCTESATPIQAAINALSGAGGTPDDGTIYIDAGTYAENVTIDGNAWSGGGSTPASLTLNGAGSATTILDGWLRVTNMNVFTFSGLAIIDNDTSGNTTYLDVSNDGDLNLSDVSVTNNAGDGAALISTGDVTVTNSDFNGSSLTGLYIDTLGSATVTDVIATGNGYGLDIIADQGIDLTNVNASDNNYFGAILDTTYGTGAITVNSSNFGVDAATGNGWTGLHAESGSTITLNSVVASYNGTNGAYLDAEGNILVNNSTFNNNVNFNYPEDPGLFALSNGGNITLNSVTANDNVYGAGAVLNTSGAGAIDIDGGFFNQNGTFGIQAGSDDGNIEINGVIASFNQVKGAYLGAFGAGNIGIYNSTFVENGSYGIYAFTNEGDIELNLVTVWGSDGGVGPGADDLTDYGAILEAGGDVTVSNSTFQFNTDVGLGIISGGQVNLNNVVVDQNGGNGVEVYSTSTAGPICEGKPPVNIVVNVDGGAFTNNGGYGLLVKPGPEGTLVFVNPATFGGNDLGDYLLDLSQEFKDCTCPPKPEEPPATKGPLIVDVPSTGGPTVEQDCETYTGTILRLPNGTSVEIGCPFEGFNKLEEVAQENLPGLLGGGITFEAAIMLGLIDAEGNILLNEDGTITVKFIIPADARGRRHSILFWDATSNDGQGGWVQLPPYEIGTSFPLNPDNSEDGRIILSGVQQIGDTMTVTVNFPGIFVLATR